MSENIYIYIDRERERENGRTFGKRRGGVDRPTKREDN